MAERRELPPNLVVGAADGHRITANLVQFVRLLRGLGFKAGPGAAAEAATALGLVGVSSRADFYWTLHALLVEREEQRPLFRQAFRLYWRHIDPLMEDLELLAPSEGAPAAAPQEAVMRRVGEAWGAHPFARAKPREIEADCSGTASAAEVLAHKDFEQMSREEWDEARRMVALLLASLEPLRARRFRPARAGVADLRATVRAALRSGGEVLALRRRAPRLRPPPLVALCDISGSMSSYSRMFLHFMHGLGARGARVRRFVFGTRLTCVDRSLRQADPDAALAQAGLHVRDWAGGTRIAGSLREFNVLWARRTLAQGATVLLATDGLERGGADEVRQLEFEAERLAKSCRRLVWLNPLLRYDSYEPLAAGARTIGRHAGEVRSIHNLASLAQLCKTLAGGGRNRAVH